MMRLARKSGQDHANGHAKAEAATSGHGGGLPPGVVQVLTEARAACPLMRMWPKAVFNAVVSESCRERTERACVQTDTTAERSS